MNNKKKYEYNMDYNDFYNKLKKLGSTEIADFLYGRFKLEKYRGNHKVQHIRYTFDDYLFFLTALNTVIEEQKNFDFLKLKTTDSSKRPENNTDEMQYQKFSNIIKEKLGQGSLDQNRKIIILNLNRMGFIDRFNKSQKILTPFNKGRAVYVKLNAEGKKLISNNTDYVTKMSMFTNGINNMLKGVELYIVYLLTELDQISKIEYTLFASFINCYIGDVLYDIDKITNLIKKYRNLDISQREAIVTLVKNFASPSKNEFFKNKTKNLVKDFGNLNNQTDSIFTHILETKLFEFTDKKKNNIKLRVGKNSIIKNQNDLSTVKRSQTEKGKYFKEHNIDAKTAGFQLHHVVPLLLAKNIREWVLLDKWENMLYIDAFTHAIITANGSRHIHLNFNDVNVELTSPILDKIDLKLGYNVLYNRELQQKMLDYNKEIIESL